MRLALALTLSVVALATTVNLDSSAGPTFTAQEVKEAFAKEGASLKERRDMFAAVDIRSTPGLEAILSPRDAEEFEYEVYVFSSPDDARGAVPDQFPTPSMPYEVERSGSVLVRLRPKTLRKAEVAAALTTLWRDATLGRDA